MLVIRYDIGSLKKASRLPNGWLKVDGYLARTGIQIYRNADGSERREYRPPDEVFKADTLGSFQGVPVTDDHPPKFLDATNTSQYSRGHVGDAVHADGDNIRASLMIYDSDLIKKIDAGKQQLSCGYRCELEATPGDFNGEHYDYIQRNIVGNHLAVVDTARGGPSLKLRLDGSIDDTRDSMKKIKIDGVEYEVSEQVEQAYSKQQARVDSLSADLAKTQGERDQMKADLASEKKARLDAEDPQKLSNRVKSRVALEVQAREILGSEVKLDALDDRGIKLAILAKLAPQTKFEGQDASYLQGRYDAAVENHQQHNPALAAANTVAHTANTARIDADPELAARNRMIEYNQNAWKNGAK